MMNDQPNFVFIMTDTQGANVLNCYNTGIGLDTPNLDRLANEGVRFDRGYTTCPLCAPARGGIFTGLMPGVCGVPTNGLAPAGNIPHMGARFERHNYHTAYMGKWHLAGNCYFDTGICPKGWDDKYWYDGRRYLNDLSDREIKFWRQGPYEIEDIERKNITAEWTWAHRVSDRAIKFLDKRDKNKPFLLVCSYDEPHGPYVAPSEECRKFDGFKFPIGPGAHDDLSGKPAHQKEWAKDLNLSESDGYCYNSRYFACNHFVDKEIGRVIDAVRSVAPSNTWIFFTSDHGDHFGAHRLGSKGPTMYEEITRIPFIILPPDGKGERGLVNKGAVSHLDFIPTMLELAGIEIPPILEGRSFLPEIRGEREDLERVVPMEFSRFSISRDGYGGFQPIRAVVNGGWKLVVNLHSSDELYNLKDDPYECENLIDSAIHSEIRESLHQQLLDELDRVRDPSRGPVWERRPWKIEPKQQWSGKCRHRPDDGFAPTILTYNGSSINRQLILYALTS